MELEKRKERDNFCQEKQNSTPCVSVYVSLSLNFVAGIQLERLVKLGRGIWYELVCLN